MHVYTEDEPRTRLNHPPSSPARRAASFFHITCIGEMNECMHEHSLVGRGFAPFIKTPEQNSYRASTRGKYMKKRRATKKNRRKKKGRHVGGVGKR